MNILITGGSGFIGVELCRRLLNRNATLTLLTRSPYKTSKKFESKVHLVSSLDDLSPKNRFDAVINLAGEPIAQKRWTRATKAQLIQSRVGLTTQIAHFLSKAEYKPQRVISGSAVGYYGDSGETWMDEESRPHEEFTHQLCDDWEKAAMRLNDADTSVAVVRTGLVVGKGGGFLRQMAPSFKLGLGATLGSGRQYMSWIHLDDMVDILLFLLDHKDLKGIFNATAPNPVTNAEFSSTLADTCHRRARLKIPAFVLKAALGEMSTLLLTGQRVAPKRLQASGFKFKFETLKPALQNVINE